MIIKSNQTAHTKTIDAERYFNQAKTTVDHLGARVAEQLASVPGAERVRRSVLKETLAYYEQFAAQVSDNSAFAIELASTHNRIGDLKRQMDSPDEAMSHFEMADQMYNDLLSDETSDEQSIRNLAVKNLNDLALTLRDVGRISEAKARFADALGFIKQGVSDTSDARVQSALTKSNYGMLLAESGQRADALPLLHEAERVLSGQSGELARRSLSATLASLSSFATQPAEAIELIDKAIHVQLMIARDSPNRIRASSELASLYNSLGSAQLRNSEYENAVLSFQKAIQLQRNLHSIAPEIPIYQQALARSLSNLAIGKQKSGMHDKAIAVAAEAAKHQRASLSGSADSLSQLGVILHNQAISLMKTSQYSVATDRLTEAIDFQQRALDKSQDLHLARDYLLNHYSNLLRCQVALHEWTQVNSTSRNYRAAANGDARRLRKVADDLIEITKLVPSGVHERRARSELAFTRLLVDQSTPDTRVMP